MFPPGILTAVVLQCVCVCVLLFTNVLRIRSHKKAIQVQSTQDTKFLASLCHPCITKRSFPLPAQQTRQKIRQTSHNSALFTLPLYIYDEKKMAAQWQPIV